MLSVSLVLLNYSPFPHKIMEAFLVSTLAVAVGEIGDKTQLLALLLAARYKKPVPIILGILVATLANHALGLGLILLGYRRLDPEAGRNGLYFN